MSVREAQQRIDAAEFAEWQAFALLEPFGDDWRAAAMQAHTTAAVWAGKKAPKVEAFMPPTLREEQRAMSSDEILDVFRKLAGPQHGNHR